MKNDLRLVAAVDCTGHGVPGAFMSMIGNSLLNDIIYKIAIAAKDEEGEKRKKKGTSHKKANRKFGMPKLAEIIGCSTKTIAIIFRWIGVQEATSEEAKHS